MRSLLGPIVPAAMLKGLRFALSVRALVLAHWIKHLEVLNTIECKAVSDRPLPVTLPRNIKYFQCLE